LKEKVLVLRKENLRIPQGLVRISEEKDLSLLKEGFFMDRSQAERDERFKQVIPYVVLMNGTDVLLVRRTKKQSESRLHNLYSIGIGGHVEEKDGNDPVEAFRNGMRRELEEEVDAEIISETFIGLINDDLTEVSRVHLGYLYIAEAEIRGVKEEDMFEWKLVSMEDLSKYKGEMEGWSKIAMDGLKSFLSQR
jgi:predicted NUDIX family phosphoesterase